MDIIHTLTTSLIHQLCLNGDTIVAVEYRKRPTITLYNLIYAVISKPSSVEEASLTLNSSKTYVLGYLKTHIRTKPSRDKWSNWLLYTINYKYCYSCNTYNTLDSFANSISHVKSSKCVQCTREYNEVYLSSGGKEVSIAYYQNNKNDIVTRVIQYRKEHIEQCIEYQKEYYIKNKDSGIFNIYAANRRARKLHATPSWANLELIKLIYANAEGAHVDHIIPLQGELVCGLHVENNLQYLTPEENLKKSNKFVIQDEI